MKYRICILFWFVSLLIYQGKSDAENRLEYFSTIDSFFGVCIKSLNHKDIPSPADDLKGSCSPWKDLSCCTSKMAASVHNLDDKGFNMSHCGPLSKSCFHHFRMDSCFYECSPYLGPWLVKNPIYTRTERAFKVPLCREACNRWFQACKNDLTCVPNWAIGFKWKKGKNVCPDKSKCTTFRRVYGTAENFCQTVWDHSWRVVDPPSSPQGDTVSCVDNFENQLMMKSLAESEARKIIYPGGAIHMRPALVVIVTGVLALFLLL